MRRRVTELDYKIARCSVIVKEEPLEGSIRTEAQPEVVLQGAP